MDIQADIIYSHTGYDVIIYFRAEVTAKKRRKCRLRRLWVEFEWRGVLPAQPIGGHLAIRFLPLDEAIAHRAVTVIISGSDEWAVVGCLLLESGKNSQNGQIYTICDNRELIGTHGRTIERGYPRPRPARLS